MGGPPQPLPFIDVAAIVAEGSTGDREADLRAMNGWVSVFRDHYQQTIGAADRSTAFPFPPFPDPDAPGGPGNPLPLEEAAALLVELAALPNVPFDYPLEGSQARAHATVQFLRERGVACGKAWIFGLDPAFPLLLETHEFGEPDLMDAFVVPAGGDHVAPFVYVRGTFGQVWPVVLDPSVRRHEPVPGIATWEGAVFGGQPGSRTVLTDDQPYSYALTDRNDLNSSHGTFELDADFTVTQSALNYFSAQRDLLRATRQE